jgi:hypothetical protein
MAKMLLWDDRLYKKTNLADVTCDTAARKIHNGIDTSFRFPCCDDVQIINQHWVKQKRKSKKSKIDWRRLLVVCGTILENNDRKKKNNSRKSIDNI